MKIPDVFRFMAVGGKPGADEENRALSSFYASKKIDEGFR